MPNDTDGRSAPAMSRADICSSGSRLAGAAAAVAAPCPES